MAEQRAVIANWADGVEQTFEFNTQVFRVEDGVEVRTAASVQPRVTWKFEALHHERKNGAERFRQSRFAGQEQIFPDPVEFFVAEVKDNAFTRPTPSGGYTFPVSDGDTLFFSGLGFRQVVSASGSDFSVDGESFSGRFKIHLTRKVRNVSAHKSSMLSSQVGVSEVEVEQTPPFVNSFLLEPEASAVEYRGYPLFSFRLNWANSQDLESGFELRGMDNDYGVPYSRQVGQVLNDSVFYCTAKNRAEVASFVSRFLAARGRLGAFYAPVALPHIKLKEPAALGSTSLKTAVAPADLQVWDAQILRNFLLSKAGSNQALGLVDIQQDPDSEGSLIEVDQPVEAAVAGETTLRWITKCRFSNDSFRVKWLTGEKAEVSFGLTALVDSFEELRMSGFRISVGGFYVKFPSSNTSSDISSEPWGDV